ncbi:putative ABC transporter permease [Clostridium sp. LIBA-8841]|uniref:putative ABC transporter permease n=1 Tax=Clostridium sp. LIBA-8841 TaxID=2987530 RepID=UPI002AC5EA63|nr:putative ABC transporter permease [Clostridium sp. LIBA-8841]MDZ5254459.1 putative ABC transporter permease [Clostridium sp. LIBA-8841]
MFNISNSMNIYKIVWIFTIGSILGYCVEMIWCYVKHGYFESRKGLIYGPISPVYGIGGIVLTLILYRFINYNGIIIFFISAIIGGIFEYLCSWVQEKTLGSVSWDYNSKNLSIHGRTSVEYSVFWGILGVFFLRDIYPLFDKFMGCFSDGAIKIITIIFLVLLIPDIIISALAVRREVARMKGVQAKNALERFLDRKYPDEFLKKIYPNMIFKFK